MNTTQLLNAAMYPSGNDNIRRKSFPYFDTQTIAAGQQEYFFFVTPLGNPFLRNKILPVSGSEVFFVKEISMFVNTPINTPALINSLNELLQQSYLQISVDNRVQCKLPGLDFIQYLLTLNEDATPELLVEQVTNIKRVLPVPILLNSTSNFEFKFVTTAAAATAFDTINIRLVLHGIQLDKLETGFYNALKGNQFQDVTATYYNTVAIPNGNEQVFQFFANANQAQNLFSKTFPLSAIETMQIQNIEVFINQPDVPIVANTIYRNRLQDNLIITVDDIQYYNSNLQDMLSVVAGFAGNITDSAAATVAYNQFLNVRQSKTLDIPLNIPAQSNVSISLRQPAASLGITGEITVALRGVETRRVA